MQPEAASPAPEKSDSSGLADGRGATPAQRALMAAEAPLARAAAHIRAAAEAKPSGFAGVALRDGVVTVYWKGKVPADLRRLLDEESKLVPVKITPARYSASELAQAAEKIRATGDRSIRSVGYTVRGDGLTATLPDVKSTPRLPDVGVAITVLREPQSPVGGIRDGAGSDKPGTKPTSATSPDSASATKGLAAAADGPWPNPSRQDDTTPAWGGAHLINSSATDSNGGWDVRLSNGNVEDADAKWHCTSAFPILDNATNTELMVGPSSCGTPGHTYVDPSGDVVNETAGVNSAWYKPLGGVSLTKPKGGAEPAVYAGDGWTQDGWQIDAWEEPIAGQHVCVSGAETGTFCGVTITDTVGSKRVWIPDYKGDLEQADNLTVIDARINNPGAIWPDRRTYVLKDGSLCNGSLQYKDSDTRRCLDTAFGKGDAGGAVYVIPSGGPGAGIIVKGMLVRSHDPGEESGFNHDMVGVDKIAAAYSNMTELTVHNDRR